MIDNVRLVNNQSTGRKRRDVADFSVVVDASGPTIEADLTNAVEQNGGAIVEVEYNVDNANGGSGTDNGGSSTDNGGSSTDNGGSSTDNGGSSTDNGGSGTENGGSSTDNGGSGTDNGGSGTDNGGSGTDNGGSGTDNGETITTTPAVTTKSQPVTDPDTGVEIIDPPTVQKTAQIQISDVTIDASDISDEVKTLIG